MVYIYIYIYVVTTETFVARQREQGAQVPSVPDPNSRCVCSINLTTTGKSSHSATGIIINPTRNRLGLNLSLRGEMAGTNSFSYGRAMCVVLLHIG